MNASVGSCTLPRLRILFLPAPQSRLCGDPFGFNMLGGSESRLRRGFRPRRNRSYGACAPPHAAGPQRAEEDAGLSYSSSLSTAINASVGSCTLPRLRILFLPAPQSRLCGDPFGFNMLGGSESRLRRGFRPRRNRSYGACAPPHAAGPQRAEEDAGLSYSSSLSTAMNASVGSCTLPRLRIFFLPSFCFSSSFFFRVMSPP